jgi:thioredoxin
MSVKNLNKELFQQELNKENSLVLVEYWAPWCVYCKRIGPAYKKIAEEFGDKLVVAQINIDEVPEIADQEGIDVIPSLVLYKNGEAIDSIVAPESKAKIQAFIEANL